MNQREQKIKNLLNILKEQENRLLKKYFENGNNTKTEFKQEPELNNTIPKYKKKEKFKKKEIIINEITNEFNQTYYNSKKNLFKQNDIPLR